MWKNELMRPWLLLSTGLFLLAWTLVFSVLFSKTAYTSLLIEEGYPLTLDALNEYYEAVPEEENAARLHQTAYEGLDRDRYGAAHFLYSTSTYNEETPEERQNGICTCLKENSKALQILKASPAYTQYRHPKNYEPFVYTQRSGCVPSHLYATQELSDLLLLETLDAGLNSQPGRALEAIETHWKLLRPLRCEPTTSEQHKRQYMEHKLMRSIEQTLNKIVLSDTQLHRLQRCIPEAQDPPIYLSRAIKGEFAQVSAYYNTFQFLKENHYTLLRPQLLFLYTISGMERFSEIHNIHHMRKMLNAVQESADSIKAEIDENKFPSYLHKCYRSSLFSEIENMTAKNILHTLLAVERFERAEKRLPSTLTELVPKYLDSIPRDYYGDAPVRYRQTEKGYLVYGVGWNGEDDKAVLSSENRYERDQVFEVKRAVNRSYTNVNKKSDTTVDL